MRGVRGVTGERSVRGERGDKLISGTTFGRTLKLLDHPPPDRLLNEAFVISARRGERSSERRGERRGEEKGVVRGVVRGEERREEL